MLLLKPGVVACRLQLQWRSRMHIATSSRPFVYEALLTPMKCHQLGLILLHVLYFLQYLAANNCACHICDDLLAFSGRDSFSIWPSFYFFHRVFARSI